ncbi:hypothetical protein C0992_008428 [Termitomyces sp. T32_za158]|nr:hypothetical protein C0992_008428 [Termitomyces sp. T32_za158]
MSKQCLALKHPMLSHLRTVLRPLAIQAAYNPIETIVFFAVVGTLAYFHILTAIKHSAFLAPSSVNVAPLRPTHLALQHADWLPVREHAWTRPAPDVARFQLHQLVFTAPVAPELAARLAASAALSHVNGSTVALALAAAANTAAAPLSSLLPPSSFRLLASLPAPSDEPVIGDTDSPKWIAYACRALVIRFYTLAQMADSLDILLILLGYVLMHVTFYLLISRSRALGSNFSLPIAIVSSSILALLLSVPIALALGIPIDPVALTEALPFLVCTVGFDKPLRLARAVFLHPHLTTPPVALSSLQPAHALPLKPAAKILTESLSLTYPPIIRDYILEIAVLVVGANSRVPGLKEVCALAALLLAVDCLLMCTYLVGVLGVMIEVRRIQTLRDLSKSRTASSRSRSNSVVSYGSTPRSSHPGTPSHPHRPPKSALVPPPPPLTWRQRFFGVKGASLIGKPKDPVDKEPNPVARLKLLLIVVFLGLHILNLITPLAPSSLLPRHTHTQPAYDGLLARVPTHDAPRARVDVGDANVQTLLKQLAASPGDDELVVRVCPPVYVDPLPTPLLLPAADAVPAVPTAPARTLEGFMDSWTRLVGDPVLSKWIVVVLAISIMLNGYLIKGIAAGAGVGVGVGTGVAGKALRFEGSQADADEDEDEDGEAERKTFTLQDVDQRLLNARLTVPSGTSNPPSISHTPSTPTAVSTPSPRVLPLPLPLPLPEAKRDDEAPARAYDELAGMYDAAEGMHAKAEVLAGMTDQEVVLLVQKNKVAAYALEKALSGGEAGWGIREKELRRAVRVRRAVLCTSFLA